MPLNPVVSKLWLVANSGELVLIMEISEIRDAEIPSSASDVAAESVETAMARTCAAGEIQ